jgi:hypothetical protein
MLEELGGQVFGIDKQAAESPAPAVGATTLKHDEAIVSIDSGVPQSIAWSLQ